MALTNSQYEQLMREYSRLQALDHQQMVGRRQTAYAKIPRLAQLSDLIVEAAVESAQARLSGDNEKAAECDRKRHDADQKIRSLLTENGFPADYLTMQYHCPDCHDTGYVEGQKCRCFKRRAISLFYTQPSLARALQTENFSTFLFRYYDDSTPDPSTGITPRENMHRIVGECRRFITDFGCDPRSLLFYGGPGLGKTFLSHCIAKELIGQNYSVLYYSSSSLFDTLARSTFEKDASEDPFADYVMECDLLILDDLGTEITNAFVSATLFRILNERISNGKSILISTNLTLPDLVRVYSERVFSRITSEFTLLGFYGDDIRIRKKLEA